MSEGKRSEQITKVILPDLEKQAKQAEKLEEKRKNQDHQPVVKK